MSTDKIKRTGRISYAEFSGKQEDYYNWAHKFKSGIGNREGWTRLLTNNTVYIPTLDELEAEERTVIIKDGQGQEQVKKLKVTDKDKENYQLNAEAHSALIFSLPENLQKTVRLAGGDNERVSKMWKTLEDRMKPRTELSELQAAENKFRSIVPSMYERDKGQEFWDDLLEANLELKRIDNKYEKSDTQIKIHIFDHICDNIQDSEGSHGWAGFIAAYTDDDRLQEITLNKFKDHIIKMMKAFGPPIGESNDKLLYTGNTGKGYSAKDSAKDSKNAPRKETRTCYYCHNRGHLLKDCRKKKRDMKLKNKEKGSDKGELLYMSTDSDEESQSWEYCDDDEDFGSISDEETVEGLFLVDKVPSDDEDNESTVSSLSDDDSSISLTSEELRKLKRFRDLIEKNEEPSRPLTNHEAKDLNKLKNLIEEENRQCEKELKEAKELGMYPFASMDIDQGYMHQRVSYEDRYNKLYFDEQDWEDEDDISYTESLHSISDEDSYGSLPDLEPRRNDDDDSTNASLDSYFYKFFYGKKDIDDKYIDNQVQATVKKVTTTEDTKPIKPPIIEEVYEDEAVIDGVLEPKSVTMIPEEREEPEPEEPPDTEEEEREENQDKDPDEEKEETPQEEEKENPIKVVKSDSQDVDPDGRQEKEEIQVREPDVLTKEEDANQQQEQEEESQDSKPDGLTKDEKRQLTGWKIIEKLIPTNSTQDEYLMMASKNVSNPEEEDNRALGDSGASKNVKRNPKGLTNVKKSSVRFQIAKGDPIKSSVRGTWPIETMAGDQVSFGDVYVVEGSRKNIISLGLCMKNGAKIIHASWERIILKTLNGTKLKFERDPRDDLYYIKLKNLKEENISLMESEGTEEKSTRKEANKDNPQVQKKVKTRIININKAHKLLGHPGEDHLKRAATALNWKLTGTLKLCEACVKAKATAKPTKKITEEKATKPGERLFLDTSGPYEDSKAANKYWGQLVCQKTSRKWSFYAINKTKLSAKVVARLRKLKGKGWITKYLRYDGGSEWFSLEKYMDENGIKPEKTPPNTQQYNGKVERGFVTIRQKAFASMLDSGHKKSWYMKYWPYAVDQATLMDNMLPRDGYKNAFEPFKEKPPVKQKDFVKWGEVGWMTVRNKLKRKWKEKAVKVYNLGNSPDSTSDCYRVYNTKTRHVCESRDIRWETNNRQDNREPDTTNENADINDDDSDDDKRITRSMKKNDDEKDHNNDDDSNDSKSNQEDKNHDEETEAKQDDQAEESKEETPTRTAKRSQPPPKTRRMGTRNTPMNMQKELRGLRTTLEGTSEKVSSRTRSGNKTNDGEINVIVPDMMEMLFHIHPEESIEQEKDDIYIDPKNDKEALEGTEGDDWWKGLDEEYCNCWFKRNAWHLVDDPGNVEILGSKNVYKKKLHAITKDPRYRVRNVVQGYNMIQGVHYDEAYAPTPMVETVRMYFALTLHQLGLTGKANLTEAEKEWIACHATDVEQAFLNADLDRKVYMKPPPYFKKWCEEHGIEYKEGQVILLTKAQYGMVDSAKLWLDLLIKKLTEEGGCELEQCKSDPCLLYKRDEEDNLIALVLLYIDDICISGRPKMVEEIKKHLKKSFIITDSGPIDSHLGIDYKLQRDNEGWYYECNMKKYIDKSILEMEKYLNKELKEYKTPGAPGTHLLKNEEETQDESGYRKFVGKLLYASVKVLPNCSNAMRDLSAHLSNPGEEHWKALKRVAGYLKHHYQPLMIREPKDLRTGGFWDSDWASDPKDRKSITSYLTTIGGKSLINWQSKKQTSVALSSCESETVAGGALAQDIQFANNLIEEVMGVETPKPSIMHGDNQSSIFVMSNNSIGPRTKHIDIRYRYVTDLYKGNQLAFQHVGTTDNPADIGSKNVKEEAYTKHTKNILEGMFYKIIHESNGEDDVLHLTMDNSEGSGGTRDRGATPYLLNQASSTKTRPAANTSKDEVEGEWKIVKKKKVDRRKPQNRWKQKRVKFCT